MGYFGKKILSWYKGRFNKSKLESDIQTIKFVNKSDNVDPEYKCEGDSGFDLRAYITENSDEGVKLDKETGFLSVTLKSLERRMIHTGLYVELPANTELQVRTRSGNAIKRGLVVLNSPGTVDEKYRGEICVIVINLSKQPITILDGDRIAQAVLMPVYNKELVSLQKVDEISTDTDRSGNGFGHTGVS